MKRYCHPKTLSIRQSPRSCYRPVEPTTEPQSSYYDIKVVRWFTIEYYRVDLVDICW